MKTSGLAPQAPYPHHAQPGQQPPGSYGPPHRPAPPSREAQYGNGALGRRTAYGSKHMAAEEIEQILRIQWKSLHSGSPYHEDYYYQVGRRALFPVLEPASKAQTLSEIVTSIITVQCLRPT